MTKGEAIKILRKYDALTVVKAIEDVQKKRKTYVVKAQAIGGYQKTMYEGDNHEVAEILRERLNKMAKDDNYAWIETKQTF